MKDGDSMKKKRQRLMIMMIAIVVLVIVVGLLDRMTIHVLGSLFKIAGLLILFFVALGGAKRCKNKGMLFIGVSLLGSVILMGLFHLDVTNHSLENDVTYEFMMFYDLSILYEIVLFILGFTLFFKVEVLNISKVLLTEMAVFIGVLFVVFGFNVYVRFDDVDQYTLYMLISRIVFMVGYLSMIVIVFMKRKACTYEYKRVGLVFLLFMIGQGVLLISQTSSFVLAMHWIVELSAIGYLGYIMYDMAYFKVISDNEETIEEARDRIESLARIDELTYVANRKYLFESLDKSFRLSKREKEPIALLMVDIDDFKEYNDRFGVAHGDSILKRIALSLEKSCLRPLDFVGRYGGEEFLVFLPYTDFEGTMEVCKRMMKNIHDMRIRHYQKENEFLTVSIGFSVIIPEEGVKIDEPIKAANDYMLKVKNTGKNDFMGVDLTKGEIE